MPTKLEKMLEKMNIYGVFGTDANEIVLTCIAASEEKVRDYIINEYKGYWFDTEDEFNERWHIVELQSVLIE